MDPTTNPTNNTPAMPAIPTPPAPEPVVPTPSDAMPNIPVYTDNTPAPEPTTSSVPFFESVNPAAEAAPVVPTTSSTPTSFGMDSSSDSYAADPSASYNTATVTSPTNKASFDPSTVAGFFTPETPSYSNGGIIAATEPITEPDPIPEPDPIEEALKAPFKAADPVPGSIGSAVSVPKEGILSKKNKKGAKADKEVKLNEGSKELPMDQPISLEEAPVVNPNNPFLNQNSDIAQPVEAAPEVAPMMAPVAEQAPAMEPAPAMETTQVMNQAPIVEATPVTPVEQAVEPIQEMAPVATMDTVMQDPNMVNMAMPQDFNMAAPAPEVPQFDPNNPLPMPGDPNAMLEMPLAYDPANTPMNPFMEAAMNTDQNMQPSANAPVKADNKKKLFIILGAAAAAVLLIIVLIVVATSGGSKPVANNTPAPAPVPTTPVSGSYLCTKSYSDDEIAKFTGAVSGKSDFTLSYEDGQIKNITSSETIHFDNDINSKAGVRALMNEYREKLANNEVDDDSMVNNNYSFENSTAIFTHKLTVSSTLDAALLKVFNVVLTGEESDIEDTIAEYEENKYKCSERSELEIEDEEEEEEEEEEEGSDNEETEDEETEGEEESEDDEEVVTIQ